MTRNREIPDSWPASNSSQPGQGSNWQDPRKTFAAKPPFVNPGSGVPDAPMTDRYSVAQDVVAPRVSSSPPSKIRQERKRGFPRPWHFGALLIVLFSGGVGFIAIALLLKLPAVPNCPATFWPTASASMRLYCAQLAANKQTAEDLLQAIALVEALPADHPMRKEINRHVEQWSLDILKIGEQKFQAGKLTEAIDIARKIPTRVSASTLVEKQIDRWKVIWAKAEGVYSKVEQELRKSNWTQAFREAVKLTSIDNKYWATTKYDQVAKKIQLAREDSAKLDKAYQLSRAEKVDDILEAIRQAEKISRESYAYKEAQDLIGDCGKKLIKLAQARLEQRNWEGVLEIANKIPPSVKLESEKADLIDLAQALSTASSGNSSDLERAIALAQKLQPDRPLYNKAQGFIDRWKRETEDVARLERARMYAESGLVPDLKSAIAEAQQVPRGNPRYSEARKEISRWTAQSETIEDQPYLDRAEQIASFGGSPSLQEAIQEASRIAPGRALYKKAQGKIAKWTDTIQREQDQPFLDQARTLANGGNLPDAIATAQQIKAGRALYKEAQNEVRGWQMEIEGQQLLQQANQAAIPGTPEALSSAIRLARQVPRSASVKDDARSAVNRWSDQLLSMANDRSSYNLKEAIEIAKMIPSGTDAYGSAQGQIQSWQSSLEPPPSPVQTSTEESGF
ncbi:chromosome segregation ATPase [Allocoleopsis sp.]|uniref:tetratricopeptide repeat protein n=1 Tax=Allocoleopsis sp. TaxID=3088169 RepID=UPI002FD2CB80